VIGLIATAGLFALWRLWIYALALLLLGFVLAGCGRRAAVLTDAALAELRYGSCWRPVSARGCGGSVNTCGCRTWTASPLPPQRG
jgi:hypothetical protein